MEFQGPFLTHGENTVVYAKSRRHNPQISYKYEYDKFFSTNTYELSGHDWDLTIHASKMDLLAELVGTRELAEEIADLFGLELE